MDAELRAYRIDPSEKNYRRLYRVAAPWLRVSATQAVRRINGLSVSGSVDDVQIEGAFELGRAARRFVYFCPHCDRVLLSQGRLREHARTAHGARGVRGIVSLEQFARTSARLAMRRTARRLVRPEIVDQELVESAGGLADVEDRLLLEIAVKRMRARLSARAKAVLEELVRSIDAGESIEVGEIDSDALREIRAAAGRIAVRRRMKQESAMADERGPREDNPPEIEWSVLSIRTMREAAKDLGLETSKRTIKAAHGDILKQLKDQEAAGERDLCFRCDYCNSLVDGEMERCWACGLLLDDGPTDDVVDSALADRARKLGIVVDGLERAEIERRIEEAETRAKRARENVDLLTIESKNLNQRLTEDMPDGWRKNSSKQYTSYFDAAGVRRIAVFHRGLKIQFSVEDGFLDGFDATFFDAKARREKHYGRSNYEYMGDTAKYARDLCLRVMREYGGD